MALVDVLSRLTISYFLAPSDLVDLGDPDSARRSSARSIETLIVLDQQAAVHRPRKELPHR